ncbi:MAG TPA: hypothetical protein VL401_00375 [Alphaproteobacteria bacterium]|jgi:spermidine synthase|nr:hypothetical protein [Alphaproteobacteria bacterium]
MFFTKILETRQSKFNGNIRVLKTLGMGVYIQSEGLTQSGGIVSTIWKTTLSKIRSTNIEIRKVLILGLGGGTVAKIVREYYPTAKITGVDIDPIMIELGEKYLNLKADKIYIQDACKVVPGKFDLVIVDLYQGDKFPKKFESEKFLQLLAKNNLVIFNRLYYKNKKEESLEFGKKLQKYFKKVDCYYPPANLMFVCYN